MDSTAEITTKSSLCGICTDKCGQNVCDKCKVNICGNCAIKSRLNILIISKTIFLCKMCNISQHPSSNYWDTVYCFSCDKVVLMKDCNIDGGGCNDCRGYDQLEQRKLLTHCKAKLIIEQFVRIGDVAQLIFE